MLALTPQQIKARVKELHKDSLVRNSVYLMLATAVLAGFGFVFWFLNAKLFDTHQLGMATGLLSVMGLLSYLSLVGFNVAFVRFLPQSPHPNKRINTGFLLVGAAALLFSLGFVLMVGVFSPTLAFVKHPLPAFLFILFSTISALSVLAESVFLAHRQTKFTLLANTVGSVIKILLPFMFVSWGAIGIFSAAGIAQTIGFALSIFILVRSYNYTPSFDFDTDFIKNVSKYCASNYLASVLNLLPGAVLPLLIINTLGTTLAAYYYIAMMIGNLLFVIPTATTRALLAEGSNDSALLSAHTKKAIRTILGLMVPAILILLLGGKYLLLIFGESYAKGGTTFLQLIALSGVAISVSSVLNALFQIRKDLWAIVLTNLASATTSISLSYVLAPHFGLVGVGSAWLLGCSASPLLGYALYRKWPLYAWQIAEEYLYAARTIPYWKYRYLRARVKAGGEPLAILFYPETPRSFHILYPLCHALGIHMTNNPYGRFDAVFAFEDATIRGEYPMLSELATQHRVVNLRSTDISKERVDEVFNEVFGYRSKIDPETYEGVCVRKSNANATHDGMLIHCPAPQEQGYVYQKFIDNELEGELIDIRVIVFGSVIPFLSIKYKSKIDRFNTTEYSRLAPVGEYLNPAETENILSFCRALGLDCGELDVLRDKNDGRIYIVDANNTSSGPRPGHHVPWPEYEAYLGALGDALVSQFLKRRVKETSQALG